MGSKTAVLWFRQDLRLTDNPALIHALKAGYSIIPVFVLDDKNAGPWAHGGASRWWLHHSLLALNNTLEGRMLFRRGDARDIIPEIARETSTQAVFWNRCYEPWRIARDKEVKDALNVECKSFNASLLWEPWTVTKNDGTPYKVFTPYYRKGCLKTEPPQAQPAPNDIHYAPHKAETGSLDDLDLLPEIKWYAQMEEFWTPGEAGAKERLADFIENGLSGYKTGRDLPAAENVSRLSPHLHFGEISPREVWHTARAYAATQSIPPADIDCFCSELGWREFSAYLLYHFPRITWDNLNTKFDDFPWREDADNENLRRWQKGQTGIPIVDAGMRQLWQTGWMHNRVRMIVASLLVKNMLIHWRRGAEWFWDCLVDADLASNSASWQWVAGCGADAAPYFRIFNPVTQGEKFDPAGEYIRRYVPELAGVPDKYIHQPWTAPSPPADYPTPIVDLKISRALALEAFKEIKNSG
ncbi:MAG: DNA photolyase family protein [Magnetococcus sp. WYHC-3]